MQKVRSLVLGAGACVLLAGCATGGVTDVTATSATLNGTVQSGDAPLTYVFQYAKRAEDLGTAQGLRTDRRTLPGGTPSRAVAEPVSGLTENTEYAYRLCGRLASSTGDDTCLATRRFTTPFSGRRATSFNGPGESTFIVPEGVFSLAVDLAGGAGGGGFNSPESLRRGALVRAPGGRGAAVRADLSVQPGERLTVRVGSAGADALDPALGFFPGAGGRGGSNGRDRGGNGGSGAGAAVSILRYGLNAGGGGGGAASTVAAGDDVLLVAGGGGGGSGEVRYAANEPRGSAAGGDGGLAARDGTAGAQNPAGGGTGATASTAGAGGAAGPGSVSAGTAGAAGGRLVGGDGGANGFASSPAETSGSVFRSGRGGGGGGGGWFGGGGGAAGRLVYDVRYDCLGQPAEVPSDESVDFSPSGGGGGSSYASDRAFYDRVYSTGTQTGDGVVTLEWFATGEGSD